MTNPSTNNGRFPSVVVTSLAATTSIAGDVDATWKGLLNGESGIGVLEDDFVADYDLPVRIGGHLAVNPATLLSRVEIRRLSYVEQLSTVLGREVWKNAGSPEVDPLRLGVSIGTGLGGGDSLAPVGDRVLGVPQARGRRQLLLRVWRLPQALLVAGLCWQMRAAPRAPRGRGRGGGGPCRVRGGLGMRVAARPRRCRPRRVGGRRS